MNELPYFAVLAQRHAWAEREYARLHADIVEARLIARARAQERAARARAQKSAARARAQKRAARKRAWLRDRVGGLVRPTPPAPYCARAAARPVRTAGVVR
ncbi:hypothetical protein ACIBI3_12675 [Actinomadura luteofluorescens]|uniref:hypothetical protein n=1 Tax=Actinomadura luteofluorescens TaxID=46163 RepID=UPI0034706F6D